jgi:hypothetical protein
MLLLLLTLLLRMILTAVAYRQCHLSTHGCSQWAAMCAPRGLQLLPNVQP